MVKSGCPSRKSHRFCFGPNGKLNIEVTGWVKNWTWFQPNLKLSIGLPAWKGESLCSPSQVQWSKSSNLKFSKTGAMMPHFAVNCLSSRPRKFNMKISFLKPFNLYHPLPLPAWLTFTAWCLVSSAGGWEPGDLVSIADVTIFGKSLHLSYCMQLITVIIFNWAAWSHSIITAVTPDTTRLELLWRNTAIQDCELLGSTSNLKYLADTVTELNVTPFRSFFHLVSTVDKQNICCLYWKKNVSHPLCCGMKGNR